MSEPTSRQVAPLELHLAILHGHGQDFGVVEAAAVLGLELEPEDEVLSWLCFPKP